MEGGEEKVILDTAIHEASSAAAGNESTFGVIPLKDHGGNSHTSIIDRRRVCVASAIVALWGSGRRDAECVVRAGKSPRLILFHQLATTVGTTSEDDVCGLLDSWELRDIGSLNANSIASLGTNGVGPGIFVVVYCGGKDVGLFR